MTSDFSRLTFCIVGLGLMGGSFARALRRLGAGRIIAVDCRKETLEEAKAENCIDEGSASGDIIKEADVCILCLYGEDMKTFVGKYGNNFRPGTLVTDVTGIKGDLPEEIRTMLPQDVEFLSAHPMAGREGQGFSMSSAEIFRGAGYIIVPHSTNTPESIAWLRHFAEALGCTRISEVSAEEHDRIIAYTSDLPHAAAAAMVNSPSMNGETGQFIAGSFRDATRVADINADMWTEIFFANRKNLLEEIGKYQTALDRICHFLQSGDKEEMKEFLAEAGRRRKELLHETNPCKS